MSKFRLFVDDDCRKEGMEDFRYPPKDDDLPWLTAISSSEAMAIVEEHGFPAFLQLDCDLGLMEQPKEDVPLSNARIMVPDTSMRFVRWLYEKYPNEEPFWNIHSMNGEASKNLESFLLGWKRSLT